MRIDEARPVVEGFRKLARELCLKMGLSDLDLDAIRDELIERHAFSPALTDHLLDGLERAGLPAERVTLAVLPFENIGDDPDQEYFADGMTDEMITVLGGAKPRRLGVIARTSSMRFKSSDASVREIGEQLGVSHIVEGSVRRQGRTVRISATLIHAADETTVWTESFNGNLDDIFELQSSVANRIGDALALELLPGSKAAGREYVPDARAYEEYLAGRFWEHKGTEQGWTKAIAHYEKAVEIDPDYALAYAALSQAATAFASWTSVSPAEPLRKAKIALDRAFELDPDLPDAHAAQAQYHLLGEWEWRKADETFQRALTMNLTNPGMAHHWYGHLLSFMNRDREARDAFVAALRLDPLSALHQACLGSTQLIIGQMELAERSLQRALELKPDLTVGHKQLGFLRERQGRLEQAVAVWEEGARVTGGRALVTGPLGYGYGRLGQVDKARAMLEELESISAAPDGYISPLHLARVYAGLGDVDRAFEQLEIAYTQREPWILALKIGPGFRHDS